MSWMAVAIGGSALIGGVASNSASKKQSNAANRSADMQMGMYNQTRDDNAPYRSAGYAATNKLRSLLGILDAPRAPTREAYTHHSGNMGGKGVLANLDPGAAELVKQGLLPDKGGLFVRGGSGEKDWFDQSGYDNALKNYKTGTENYQKEITDPEYGSLMHKFDANDLTNGLSPNYDFMLGQGQGATNALANRGGGLISGNALKGINDYTQNYAGNAYQQAFSNYTANQTNIFNRLSTIAGFGQAANQVTGPVGATYGNNIGNSYMAAGQAQASGIVGGANAIGAGVGGLGSWYGIQNMGGNNTTPYSPIQTQNAGSSYEGGNDIYGVQY